MIVFKNFIMADNVTINHDVGIEGTTIKELMKLERDPEGELAFHPDLVNAAMTSVLTMVCKYNGVSDEEIQQHVEKIYQSKTNEGNAQEDGIPF
jgi:hypothetical protein